MSPPNPSYSTDCLHISGEVDLLPIFMEWGPPPIIWCSLCFQKVFMFYYK
jgi:hypothetical protein